MVPFYGAVSDGIRLRSVLTALTTESGDEVVVADNTEDGRFGPAGDGIDVVRASLERSSYYARNVGAAATNAPWLLFIDSDTRPPSDLLERYFSSPLPQPVGIVAGGVRASPDQQGLIPRYAASRRHIDPSHYEAVEGRRPAGITANLLVRRAAWRGVGGFQEGVRSGADLEFCWRVQDAGWTLIHRPEAWLHHDHVEDVRRLVRKTARHASGGGWVNERYPGAFRRPRIFGGLLRAAAGVVVWTAARQPERARFKAIDGLFLLTDAGGRLLGNRAKRDDEEPMTSLVVAPDGYPNADSGASVEAIVRLGPGAVVHSDRRSESPDPLRRRLQVEYAEDEGTAARIRAGLALMLRPYAAPRAVRVAPARLPRLAPAAARAAAARADIRPLTEAEVPAARRLATLAGRPLGATVLDGAITSVRSSSRSPLP